MANAVAEEGEEDEHGVFAAIRQAVRDGGTVDRFMLLAYAKSSRSDWLNERFTIHTARNDGTFFRETDPFVFTSVAPMVEEYVLSTRRREAPRFVERTRNHVFRPKCFHRDPPTTEAWVIAEG